jgi:hypothetical protein
LPGVVGIIKAMEVAAGLALAAVLIMNETKAIGIRIQK